VIVPGVTARMKQFYYRAVFCKSCDVTAFGAITNNASERKVCFVGRAPMLFADDVINFAAVKCFCLGDEAVFA